VTYSNRKVLTSEQIWLSSGWVTFCVKQLQSWTLEAPFSHQALGGLGVEWVSYLHFGLSLAMAIHSSNSLKMPLLLSALSNVLPSKSSVDNQSIENVIPNQSVTAAAPGSWACVLHGQPNEESNYESSSPYQECGRVSRKWDMVVEGIMEVHAAHATSTPADGNFEGAWINLHVRIKLRNRIIHESTLGKIRALYTTVVQVWYTKNNGNYEWRKGCEWAANGF